MNALRANRSVVFAFDSTLTTDVSRCGCQHPPHPNRAPHEVRRVTSTIEPERGIRVTLTGDSCAVSRQNVRLKAPPPVAVHRLRRWT